MVRKPLRVPTKFFIIIFERSSSNITRNSEIGRVELESPPGAWFQLLATNALICISKIKLSLKALSAFGYILTRKVNKGFPGLESGKRGKPLLAELQLSYEL